MSFRDHLRGLITIGPHRGEHTVAIRAACSVGIPLLILLAVGHIEWSLYATFGAFASLYGRAVPLNPRLKMQASAGLALIIAVLLGVLVGVSPARSWVMIPIAAVGATIVALISHRRNWHPPGPLFMVFAFGACASVPSQWSSLPVAAAVVISAVLFTLGLTWLFAVVGRNASGRSGRHPVLSNGPAGRGERPPLIEWRLRHYPIRFGIGVAAAGLLATAIGVIGHPYWAMVGAVVPMAAPDQAARLLRAVQRSIGTLIGVVIAWGVLSLDLPPILIIVVAALLQAGAELFVGRNYGLALLFITPLALSMTQLAHPLPIGQLIRDRALETLLGVLVAVVITLLTRERRQDLEEED